jgi:hypothetical protein
VITGAGATWTDLLFYSEFLLTPKTVGLSTGAR